MNDPIYISISYFFLLLLLLVLFFLLLLHLSLMPQPFLNVSSSPPLYLLLRTTRQLRYLRSKSSESKV